MNMRTALLCVVLAGVAVTAAALNSGTDVLVAAGARAGSWVTDLYVMNPGTSTVEGSVFWLVRDRANPDPISISFSLEPGETLVLEDVVGEDFGFNQAAGAFRVTADGEVVVNSRIYSADGDRTFGQGFEGVPAEFATAAGRTADIVGLSNVSGVFRTNFYCLAGAEGASMNLELLNPDGSVLATGELELEPYEPYLKRIRQTLPVADFEQATLRVSVTEGSAVVGASKVDELSTDPTTLESSAPMVAKNSIDGTYQLTITDGQGYASGGRIVIADGIVRTIDATYANWDKDSDEDGEADCPLLFRWGAGFPETPVGEVASGVEFSDSYETTGSGALAWNLEFIVNDGLEISGSITATGSGFPASGDPDLDESGCNGAFPVLTLSGGKINSVDSD